MEDLLMNYLELDACQFGFIGIADGMLAVWHLQVGLHSAQFGGEVAQAVIGKHGNNHTDIWIALRYLDSRRHVAAGRDAAENTLFTRQATRHLNRFVGSGGDNAIEI